MSTKILQYFIHKNMLFSEHITKIINSYAIASHLTFRGCSVFRDIEMFFVSVPLFENVRLAERMNEEQSREYN